MKISDNPALSDLRIRQWQIMEKARRETREPGPADRPHHERVITISRQFGAGGHAVAEQVAAQLGSDWQIWDKEIVDEVARNAQVRTWMVEELDEKARNWIEEMIAGIGANHALEAFGYRRYLVQIILSLAHQGNKIIIGRGANFMIPDALNVRLRATLDNRVQAIMKRMELTHEAALKKVQRVDHERAEFTRSVFGRDIEDPAGYDLFVQVDSLGIEAAAAAISAAAGKRAPTSVHTGKPPG